MDKFKTITPENQRDCKAIKIVSENTSFYVHPDEFAEKMGVRYLSGLEIARTLPNKFAHILEKYLKRDEGLFQFNKINLNLTRLYGRLVRDGYTNTGLYIKRINLIKGYGVYADKSISRAEMIGEYTGVLKVDFIRNKQFALDYVVEGFVIDPKGAGNITRYVNHDFTPNVRKEFVFIDGMWHVIFVAKSDIESGEQLFHDYGKDYWFEHEHKPLNLRKLVKAELQKTIAYHPFRGV